MWLVTIFYNEWILSIYFYFKQLMKSDQSFLCSTDSKLDTDYFDNTTTTDRQQEESSVLVKIFLFFKQKACY